MSNIRDTFFFSQVKVKNKVEASASADFLVNESYTFEIGGKNKTKKQIKGLADAFVVKDDIEIGSGSSIPLWLFGFLY